MSHFGGVVAHLHLLLVEKYALGQFKSVDYLIKALEAVVGVFKTIDGLAIICAFSKIEDLIYFFLHSRGEFDTALYCFECLDDLASVGCIIYDGIDSNQTSLFSCKLNELGEEFWREEL